MRVATHDGSFHADDVFAIAALRRVEPGLEVVRTRDPETLAACDVRVDVGRRSDPASGDFDHHQKGGAGTRPNGIPFASFGLVWRHHGAGVCGDERVAAKVDAFLVQGVDAIDTGFTLSRPVLDGVRPLDVSSAVDAFNPAWDEEAAPEDRLRRFLEATELAGGILERAIAGAHAHARAADLVHAAVTRTEDPRIVELDRKMPWQEAVVTGAPDALFVVYPRSDGWAAHAVPERLGAFDNRRDLPEAWAGLAGPELAEATGVPDAVFCHAARFFAVAESREGILALVRRAVDGA